MVCKMTEWGLCKIELLQMSFSRVGRNVGEAENGLQKTVAAVRLYDCRTMCYGNKSASSGYCVAESHQNVLIGA